MKTDTKVQFTSISAQVYEKILSMIASESMHEGDQLNIDKLALSFGVSVIPTREALVRLNAHGIVDYIPNKGFKIAKRPGEADLKELFHARLMIEVSSLMFSQADLVKMHIKDLKAVNADIKRCKVGRNFEQYKEFVELNDKFHRIIVSMSGNHIVIRLYDELAYSAMMNRILAKRGVPDLQIIHNEHRDIIECLDRGDAAQASNLLKSHIEKGRDRLIEDTYSIS